MIQRIQTVYLILGILLNSALYFTPLYGHALKDPSSWITIAISAAIALATLVILISIFLYKNRPKQVQLVKISMFLQIIGLGFLIGIFFSLGGVGLFLYEEVLSLLLPIVTLLFQYLAIRKIKKDEDLVRSMDRIR